MNRMKQTTYIPATRRSGFDDMASSQRIENKVKLT